MAGHDGLARSINPAHTLSDGDTLFALGTGATDRTPGMTVLSVMAAEAVARATVRAVRAAHTFQAGATWLPGVAGDASRGVGSGCVDAQRPELAGKVLEHVEGVADGHVQLREVRAQGFQRRGHVGLRGSPQARPGPRHQDEQRQEGLAAGLPRRAEQGWVVMGAQVAAEPHHVLHASRP
jgi:hypothetical protein